MEASHKRSSISAMKLALEALELYQSKSSVQMFDDAVKALRQALETEPFEYWNAVEGWVKIDEVREHFDAVGCGTIYKSAGEGRSPLYTAPPKQWVGLTDEQVEDEWERITGHSIFGGARSEGRAMYISPDEVIEFSRAIEAKLKEKNGGEYRNGATTEKTKLNQENT